MATDKDFIEYVCDQISGTGMLSYKKMFGEYMVYVNSKPVLLVCDNTVYVKKNEKTQIFMPDVAVGVPYGGAKEHFILDIDDGETAKSVVTELEKITPLPKPKKAKSKN